MEIESGVVVMVTAPNFVRGKKLGVVIKKCKDHDGGWIVELMDPNIITKKICVGSAPGDGISLVAPQPEQG